MVEPLTVRVNDAGIRRRLARIPKEMPGAVSRAFTRAGAYWEDRMKQDHFTGSGKGSFINPFKDKLRTRTGQTRNGIKFLVRKGKTPTLTLRSRGPHIFTHEFGATIRPKRGRYLTIPTQNARTASGAVKGGARLTVSGGVHQTKDGERTFILGDGDGAGIFVSRGGRAVRLYTLKRRVKIPPRLGFFREFRKRTRPRLERELDAALANVTRGRR